MPNLLSNISERFRDELLNRNLPIISNLYTNNRGQSFNFNSPDNNIVNQENLENLGDVYRTVLSTRNRYIPTEDYRRISIEDTLRADRTNTTYDNITFNLSTGVSSSRNGDLISSIINRTISDTYNDTPLGLIGVEQLQFELGQKLASNIINETVGRVNTNPISLIKGNEIFVPNYDITVPKNPISKTAEFLARVSGYEIPVSIITKEAIGWNEYIQLLRGKDYEDRSSTGRFLSRLGFGRESGLSTESRVNELLKFTSVGQKKSLFDNLGRNKYRPEFSDPKLFGLLGDRAVNSNYYIGNKDNTNIGDSINYPTKFNSNDFNVGVETKQVTVDDDWYWEPKDENPFNNKTLLYTTQKLVNERSDKLFIDQTKDSLGDVSRGKNIKSDGVYCRVWLKNDEDRQYNRLSNLVRHEGLRNGDKRSVLLDNGMVGISPLVSGDETIKKFMFSIENLAWADDLKNLPECEIGSGDLLSGKKGRVMWFPPYDLTFTDNTSVNWETTQFIGRSEPIYTYNSTERTGQLQFKIVVDHPSILNEIATEQIDDDTLEKFFSGCEDIYENIVKSKESDTELREKEKQNYVVNNESRNAVNNSTIEFNVYFPNAISEIPTTYENGDGVAEGTTINESEFGDGTSLDRNDLGLNKDFYDNQSSYESKLTGDEGKNMKIEIIGYASTAGTTAMNDTISLKRAQNVKNLLIGWGIDSSRISISSKGATQSSSGVNDDTDTEQSKKERKVSVKAYYSPVIDENINKKSPVDKETIDKQLDKDEIKRKLINECNYFKYLDENAPYVTKTIKDKIKHFHPAFHSTTPEGLNSRLTFLMQCTRQGPSINQSGAKSGNLAFGRPPVCIMRIGDFYYTKMVIDSLSISYDPVTWDLNPEGIGVQPMIAVVDMGVKILGGESLSGPINKLQNALSFNFFANTELYEDRSDRIVEESGEEGNLGYKIESGLKNIDTPTENDVILNDLVYKKEQNIDQITLNDQIISDENE